MVEGRRLGPGEPRSAGSIPQRRVPQDWPKDRRFRILSIDGGGIRGIFPAAILAGLERRYAGGRSIASYFDLVAGTSTGGILALGLGAGITADQLAQLYIRRGCEVFPPFADTPISRLKEHIRNWRHYGHYLYDRDALKRLLTDQLGDRLFGQSRLRLCIPAFEGKHSEVFVFKTPHHRDYQTDRFERMVDVGLATAAAPTYFRPLEHNGYTLVDGGVWSNNPIMLAVVEALICFDIARDKIDVLSIGCGNDKYVVSKAEIAYGGIWHWRKIMAAAMRLQSLAATNQARLLLGPPSIIRLDPPAFEPPIRLDDWSTSAAKLPPVAEAIIAARGEEIAALFMNDLAPPFEPVEMP
jgi:patatin-like phospholipase/acyl hydrolase